MASLPPLQEAEMQAIDAAFADFLSKTQATASLLVAEGGFLISSYGKASDLDPSTFGALAANSFLANLKMAELLSEQHFNCTYQQGQRRSVFIQSIDGSNLVVVVFPVNVSVGLIKHYAGLAAGTLSEILESARAQASGAGIELSLLNLPNSEEFFRKKVT